MPTKPVTESITVDSDTFVNLAIPPDPVNSPAPLNEYTCERCGYHYQKASDFAPLLCYRCMRFIAKKVFVVMNTIQPPTSRPVVGDI